MSHYRTTYDSMRLQTFFLLNVQLERKNQIKEVEKLISFPWDKKNSEPVKKQSVEEMKQILIGITKKSNTKKS